MNADDAVKKMIGTVVEKIRTAYKPEKIILFGSYAYGEPGRDSDIDLLVIKETDERPIDRRMTVRRIVTDPKRRVALEILVLTPGEIRNRLDVGDQFISEILDKGEILYAA
jgi:predicted nucleotidyltransferase